MNVAQIRTLDVANGPGLRVTLFVSGCNFNCFNCFNKEYQDFNYGDEFTDDHLDKIIEELQDDKISGLSILGGEPLEHCNVLSYVIDTVKKTMRPEQSIWLWSGYKIEDILLDDDKKSIIEKIDVLVDGLFIQAKKDLTLKFRGSSNQRIIDIPLSMKNNKVMEKVI